MLKPPFHRDPSTWLAYFLLALFAYFLNILGPITPYLMGEMNLTYTLSSLHFTAFAAGLLVIGVVGDRLVRRWGRWSSLWAGAFGMSLSAVLLISVKNPWVTIPACFLMGTIGSFIIIIVPSILSEHHGEHRAIALSEANVTASFISALAPLVVGWTAGTVFGWRLSLAAAAVIPILLLIAFWNARPRIYPTGIRATGEIQARRHVRLPRVFWVYWIAQVLAVAVEFCMVFWSAGYLETELHMLKASAAQGVSLFLAGMILGRLAGSVLVRRIQSEVVVLTSTFLALLGFVIFWLADTPLTGLGGLFLAGLGTANLYPLILSLAIASAGALTVEASSRATLASGTAILLLPLFLGGLADVVGIRWAFGIVVILLLGVQGMLLAARSKRLEAAAP